MESVVTTEHEVHFNEIACAALQQLLSQNTYSKVVLLVDENTRKHCLPVFLDLVPMTPDGVIVIKPGEQFKTISACVPAWERLSELGCDRKSLLINLGGGVVTDLGGFVASTFKRGIDFIHIPTSLLAMVDAAIGGKTGVDLGSLKNQVGVIVQPKMVLVFPKFLETLDQRQLNSGFAEMLKHGLIRDHLYWNTLAEGTPFSTTDHIRTSIHIKGQVVSQDPFERNLRKTLNFGHTLGHAIESYFLQTSNRSALLHGEAIAIGMILEGYLSHKLTGLSRVELDEIKRVFLEHFNKKSFSAQDEEIIIDLLKHDKKNSHGHINFVLLNTIGNAVTDIQVAPHLFQEAFSYYKE
ncbi:MAG: 3-dehydroquinate synthase [Bacteroidota bacterium]